MQWGDLVDRSTVGYKETVYSPEAVNPHSSGTPDVPSPRNCMRWWIHLLVIGAYPLIVGLFGWNRAASSNPALTSTARGLMLTCIVQLVIFGAVFLLGWLASRAGRDDLLLGWRTGLWPVPLGVVYSVALRFALGLIALLVLTVLLLAKIVTLPQVQEFAQANRPDVGAMVDIRALRSDPLYFWLTLTFVSFVVAGFREELWRSAVLAAFRALWPGRFSSIGGQIVAIGFIAIVFGLGHLAMGPLAVLAATWLGVGLGIIMVLHRSIWPAVIAHGAFNATTFALLPWASEKLPVM